MIVLAQAVWRDVTIHNAISVQQAVMTAGEPVMNMINAGDALIARSRSILATRFLREDEFADADVLVFVDGDITFEPHSFKQIVAGARETGDIYGGIYVTRAREPHAASRSLNETPWAFYRTEERRPLEVQYLATGFMAIPRSLLEEMVEGEYRDIDGTHTLHDYGRGANAESVIDFFRTFGVIEDDGVAHWLSEDWAFCERARQLGHKVWADQSVILGHQGAVTLTVEDLAAPTEPIHPLIESLPADIAAWAGKSEGEVRSLMLGATARLAELWDASDAGWYEREDVGTEYVYDLAHWHMQGAAQHFYDQVHYHFDTLDGPRKIRILDYGAGIGTLSLMLAQYGHTVRAVEPNAVMREFMMNRAVDPLLPLFIHDQIPDEGDWQADLVIATHVFEHLTPTELSKAMRDIRASLAEGGLLFYENDFHADEGHPQHFDYSDVFPTLLADAGFEDLGDGWARKTAQQPVRGRDAEEVASGLV